MSRSDAGLKAVWEEVGDASNLLVLSPTLEADSMMVCPRLLTSTPEAVERVLYVSLTESPDQRVESLREHLEYLPDRIGVISVSDPGRSASVVSDSEPISPETVRVESVSSPGDLTGIGIRVSSVLEDWTDVGNPTIGFCFHSLSTLLQYVDVQDAFRFLHVLTGRVDTVGAYGHYHLDPGAHDERTINTVKTLFDAVVEIEDGEWTVRTR